jgi:hypothetical protein
MNHSPLTFAVLFAAALPARAQLTLNQVGGAIGGGNYGTQGSTSAFGFDEIGAGTIPIHKIPNIRDGVFGNGNSWIGDSPNSFVGLNFGATAVPVGQVAWGRDNTGNFFDRTAGTYTVHYTQVPSPGTALPVTGDPATGWATIGSVNYLFAGAAGSPLSMSSRHVWGFPSVNATGIRVTAPGSSFADGACIDELEAYTFAAAPLSLVTSGGSMNVSTNLALTGTALPKTCSPAAASRPIPTSAISMTAFTATATAGSATVNPHSRDSLPAPPPPSAALPSAATTPAPLATAPAEPTRCSTPPSRRRMH